MPMYKIRLPKSLEYDNLSATSFYDDKVAIIDTYKSVCPYDDTVEKFIAEGIDTDGLIEYMKTQQEYWDMEKFFKPLAAIVHVLAETPTWEEVKKLRKTTPEIAVIMDSEANCYIAFRVISDDNKRMEAALRAAYMAIDGVCPF